MSENCPNILNKAKGEIIIDFDSEEEANVIYRAIYLELKTAHDHRSKTSVEVKGKSMIIHINSQDMTSFRASVNSIVKWIKLSYEIINTINS